MRARPARAAVVALIVLAGGTGCEFTASGPATATLTASSVRAARRAYDGAPPVIPHPPLNIRCAHCHTDTGQESPPLGFAPANPHASTAGMSTTAHCQQCHVFRRQDELFVESNFVGLTQRFAKADRLYPGAPPVIPHRVFMRENCNSCHSGPAARPEIRCSHPQRANCRQCHAAIADTSAQPSLTTAETSAAAGL